MKKILSIICLGILLILSSPKTYANPALLTSTTVHQMQAIQKGDPLPDPGFYTSGKALMDAMDAKKEANQTLFVTTLNDYMNNGGCWFCSTFASLLTAINKLATTIFKELSNLFMILLGLGLLFIILFKVGKMLIQLQEVNLMQFLQDLFKPLGRGIIAAALLTTFTTASATVAGDNIFSLLITPFLELSLSLSSKIITTILSFS